jgi:NaMN:DMB phosphoribosyltransferase
VVVIHPPKELLVVGVLIQGIRNTTVAVAVALALLEVMEVYL